MKFILSNPELVASARLLAEELDIRLSVRPLEEAPSIRWGNSAGEYLKDTKYNDPVLIHESRKDILSDIMVMNGIPCVEIHRGDIVPDHFPVVRRNILAGAGGAGIKVIRSPEEFDARRSAAWSYWRQFDYELGVHIFDGEVLRIFKKIWTGPENEPQYPIRNSDNGYHFRLVSINSFPKLPALLKQFYRVFPIGFARLDIGWDIENRTYRIIECNSAPSVAANHNTLAVYAEHLRNKI